VVTPQECDQGLFRAVQIGNDLQTEAAGASCGRAGLFGLGPNPHSLRF
jgi:hypothetical protein